jgi:hypothetical protein
MNSVRAKDDAVVQVSAATYGNQRTTLLQRSCDKSLNIGYPCMTMKRTTFLTVCVLLLVACGSSDGGPSSQDAGEDSSAGKSGAGKDASVGASVDAGVSGSSEIVGHLDIKLVGPTAASGGGASKPGSTTVSGKVYDGPIPSETVWDTVDEQGDCKLLTPRAPFCKPSCGSSAVCVEDGECQDNPTPRNLGTLTVKGVKTTAGADEFEIEPVNNSYMNGAAASLPFAAFAEGDQLSIESSGGDYAPISLEVPGIAPLELKDDAALALEADQPLHLAWVAPAQGATSRISVQLDISHHGGSKGKIECDADDSGSLDIAAPLIGKLIDLGVAGFPTVIVTRGAVDTAPIQPGLVELVVSMKQERAVTVPGVASCTADTDCEDGKHCQKDLTCQ